MGRLFLYSDGETVESGVDWESRDRVVYFRYMLEIGPEEHTCELATG